MNNATLTVYKASAGSGKTFTLTVEYLKQLLANPHEHASILAVTFTNKATEEMKMRILSQLYGVWKGLEASDGYLKAVCSSISLSKGEAQERAGEALHLLLHDYSRFRVTTIDSFFQTILRNLAHELDLATNLRTELRDEEIEAEAVDALIADIASDKALLNWVLRYVKENMAEDKGWDVVKLIKTFGKAILKDEYKEVRQALADKVSSNEFCWSYMEQLRDHLRESNEDKIKHASCVITLKHMHELRLLHRIEEQIATMNRENYRFLLSDTQQLLHDIIGTSDSPFIYEKTGARLKSIMIDEFQDTGRLQWANFKVLLNDCMAHSSHNLIVGDVKQSIYRWRSGDWRLLNNIEAQFSDSSRLEVRDLLTNWRSDRRIVLFNNTFFSTAAVLEAAQSKAKTKLDATDLIRAYADVEQSVPEGKGTHGYVSVKLLPSKITREGVTISYDEAMLEEIKDIILKLTNKGIPQREITILVRDKKHMPSIAQYITARTSLTIISNEAFQLSASQAVQIIIHALRLIQHPTDKLTEATLATLCNGNIPEAFFNTAARPRILYELIEWIYSIFKLEEMDGQSAYIAAFYDEVAELSKDNIVTTATLLKAWDNKIHETTIQSDEVDGIRIFTIHKSKGLEFGHVIIPYCNWLVDHTGAILWCQTKQAPFNAIPYVPIDYSSAMQSTIYAPYYNEEYLQGRVDNLNLLYVAFTRAVHSLHVVGKRGGYVNYRSHVIEKSIADVSSSLGGTLVGTEDKKGVLTFEYGEIEPYKSVFTEDEDNDNVFLKRPVMQDIVIRSFKDKFVFRQSNGSREFVEGEDTDDEQQRYIHKGAVLHRVLSAMATATDLDTTLESLRHEGVIDGKEALEARKLLAARLSSGLPAEWFSGRWQLYNECTILTTANAEGGVVARRPDRVMTDGKTIIVVDFKFGRPRAEHSSQVSEYMTLLSRMNATRVEGYLWYVYKNEIVRL